MIPFFHQTYFPRKKILLTAVLLCGFCLAATAQTTLPYAKMLSLTKEQIKEGKFKYDDYRNQYVLRKGNGRNTTANVLNALGGTTADIRPHPDDYQTRSRTAPTVRSRGSMSFFTKTRLITGC